MGSAGPPPPCAPRAGWRDASQPPNASGSVTPGIQAWGCLSSIKNMIPRDAALFSEDTFLEQTGQVAVRCPEGLGDPPVSTVRQEEGPVPPALEGQPAVTASPRAQRLRVGQAGRSEVTGVTGVVISCFTLSTRYAPSSYLGPSRAASCVIFTHPLTSLCRRELSPLRDCPITQVQVCPNPEPPAQMCD